MRRESRTVKIGSVTVGGGNPVAVQSMLNVPASDIRGNVEQAKRLEKAGCQILRVAVPTAEDARLVTAIKNEVGIPLVADIHFDYRAAIAAAEAGADKIRINPGNIGGDDHVAAVVRVCRQRGLPIRIGVNGGSLEPDLLAKFGRPVPEALCESAMRHVRILESHDFGDIVISIKSSRVTDTIEAYRLVAKRCGYPLHIGVTEAGTLRSGLIKSAMGIGCLLMEGIGDTLRVSLTDDPEREVEAGFEILRAAGYPVDGPEIISCPTCGRTRIDVKGMAEEVERSLRGSKKNIRVAVMGCVVNGPGEAKDADIGIAGGDGCAVLIEHGKVIRTLRGDLVGQLLEEIERMD